MKILTKQATAERNLSPLGLSPVVIEYMLRGGALVVVGVILGP
jgi:hypothetical protein